MHVHAQVDSLLRAELRDENIWVCWGDDVLAAEVLLLVSGRNELDVLCVNVRIVVRLVRIGLATCGILVDGAGHVELETHSVVVEAVRIRVFSFLGLLKPLEVVAKTLFSTFEGDQAQTVSEDFVLDDRGVVLDVNVLNGESRDLGDEDATEGICERGVNADEGEGGVEGVVVVELDGESLLESFEGVGSIFAGNVARVVDRAYICDGLEVDTDSLQRNLSVTHGSQKKSPALVCTSSSHPERKQQDSHSVSAAPPRPELSANWPAVREPWLAASNLVSARAGGGNCEVA